MCQCQNFATGVGFKIIHIGPKVFRIFTVKGRKRNNLTGLAGIALEDDDPAALAGIEDLLPGRQDLAEHLQGLYTGAGRVGTMAPVNGTRTLTINGTKVRVVGTSSEGCGTGDSVMILEDESGQRSRWFFPHDQTSIPVSHTGDSWGTLR